MAGSDRISLLPAHILDKILVLSHIEDAARTAVLSTYWRDILLNLTELNFDRGFILLIQRKYSGHYEYESVCCYVINKVLMNHNGPILKIVFELWDFDKSVAKSLTFDCDQWLIFVTQKGVEEIYLGFKTNAYKLPNCIFCCQTLKRLHLRGVCVDFRNAACILPNATSLCFNEVDFDPSCFLGSATLVPMLENLSFRMHCKNMFHLNIAAPKLSSLEIINCASYQSSDGFNLDLSSLCTLDLDSYSLQVFVKGFTRRGQPLQPLALNVKYLKLSKSWVPENDDDGFISALAHLLCPKLCKLNMGLLGEAEAVMSILLKKLCSADETYNTLQDLELGVFAESWSKMCFIKMLPFCFPSLEKIVIRHRKLNSKNCKKESQRMQKVLHYLHGSLKVKIVTY